MKIEIWHYNKPVDMTSQWTNWF